jgi:methyl-accepting chemotaxis protein
MAIFILSNEIKYHLAWKQRLRRFLKGKENITEAELVSHKDCNFGKWFYSEGLKRYSNIPEMIELEEVHVKIHKIAKKIYKMKEEGNVLRAEKELLNMEPVCMKLFNLMTAFEKIKNGK